MIPCHGHFVAAESEAGAAPAFATDVTTFPRSGQTGRTRIAPLRQGDGVAALPAAQLRLRIAFAAAFQSVAHFPPMTGSPVSSSQQPDGSSSSSSSSSSRQAPTLFGGAAYGDAAAVAALSFLPGFDGPDVAFAAVLMEAIGTDIITPLDVHTPPDIASPRYLVPAVSSPKNDSHADKLDAEVPAKSSMEDARYVEPSAAACEAVWARHCIGSHPHIVAVPNNLPFKAAAAFGNVAVVAAAFDVAEQETHPSVPATARQAQTKWIMKMIAPTHLLTAAWCLTHLPSSVLQEPLSGSRNPDSFFHRAVTSSDVPLLLLLADRCRSAGVQGERYPSAGSGAATVSKTEIHPQRRQHAHAWWLTLPSVGPTALGHTVQHVAAQRGDLRMLRWLRHLGADFAVSDLRGELPLHYAVNAGHLHAVRFLVHVYPAGASHASRTGDTPLDLAVLDRSECAVDMAAALGGTGAVSTVTPMAVVPSY